MFHSVLATIMYSPVFVYQLIALILAQLVVIYWLIKKASHRMTERRQLEEKLNEIQLQKQVLEVETMKHKLNPHLFKNVLNSIQSHAYHTYQALDKLAGVLDYILYESDQQLVSVQQEFLFARNLIDINRLKLSPLFDLRTKEIVEDADPVFDEPLLAPLISAPLIENAFKHADLQSDDAFIVIHLECRDGILSLQVANKISDKPSLKKEKSGIGNQSLEKRLQLIYGDFHKLHKEIKDRTYKVSLTIDLLGYKNKMHTGG